MRIMGRKLPSAESLTQMTVTIKIRPKYARTCMLYVHEDRTKYHAWVTLLKEHIANREIAKLSTP